MDRHQRRQVRVRVLPVGVPRGLRDDEDEHDGVEACLHELERRTAQVSAGDEMSLRVSRSISEGCGRCMDLQGV